MWQLTVVNRPLLSSKGRPHFKTHLGVGTNKNMAVSTRPETKNNCGGEGQQQTTALFSALSKNVGYLKLLRDCRNADSQFVDAFQIHIQNYFITSVKVVPVHPTPKLIWFYLFYFIELI
jgi:hypothetical protein